MFLNNVAIHFNCSCSHQERIKELEKELKEHKKSQTADTSYKPKKKKVNVSDIIVISISLDMVIFYYLEKVKVMLFFNSSFSGAEGKEANVQTVERSDVNEIPAEVPETPAKKRKETLQM